MNSNQGTNDSRCERWGTVTFLVYCASTIFMVFFSTTAVQIWPYPWNKLTILVACLLPLLLVLVWRIPAWIYRKQFQKEFYFALTIVILGILNIVFSENQPTTLKVMGLFLISGIGIFAITSCLLTTKFRKTIFLWLFWMILLALCIYGTLEYINKKPILLLSYNPIPAGSLLILLFVGPFLLFSFSSWWLRFLQLSSIVFGVAVIVMIGKRGPILGLLAMVILFGILVPGRRFWIFPLIALILVGTGYKMRNHLPPTLRFNLISHENTIFRLENYFLASHIFLKKPLFGIGLHVPLAEYLKDYHQKITNNTKYPNFIKATKTLENIILCGFVEMGGLFSITYIALIIYLLKNLFHGIKDNPAKRLQAVLFLIPLAGFLIHSMTFDSLIYPHLNWLFHSFLGLMANFDKI
jgi:hypothetical protein